MTALITKHLVISGRVQGVGYRASFYYAAQRLGIFGWVRNRRDKTVEAMIHGSLAAINELIEWAHCGPDLARIDAVTVTDGAGEFDEFKIEDTV